MMAAGVLSIITVFLPYYIVESETLMGGIPMVGKSPRLLITNFSGVGPGLLMVFVSGAAVIGAAVCYVWYMIKQDE